MATMKQKLAMKSVLNGATISGSMIKAGYSKTTASTTGKLTNTKGWKELLDIYLPEKKIAKKHREMLAKTEKLVVNNQIVETNQPHTDVNRALEMAYKLRGAYQEDKGSQNQVIVVNVSGEIASKYGEASNVSVSNVDESLPKEPVSADESLQEEDKA
jgi:hypothetical protein